MHDAARTTLMTMMTTLLLLMMTTTTTARGPKGVGAGLPRHPWIGRAVNRAVSTRARTQYHTHTHTISHSHTHTHSWAVPRGRQMRIHLLPAGMATAGAMYTLAHDATALCWTGQWTRGRYPAALLAGHWGPGQLECKSRVRRMGVAMRSR